MAIGKLLAGAASAAALAAALFGAAVPASASPQSQSAAATAAAQPPTVVASEWSDKRAVVRATCPTGTQLIGGGVDSRLITSLDGPVIDAIEANAPDETTPNSWKVQAKRGQARAFALCVTT